MLYIIPTPIGNLDDITYRCIKTLQESDLIIVESFEKSKKLFKKYNISAPIVINNTFNESNKLDYIITKIQLVEHSCLISDSGTPGISDPGFLIIRKCIELQIPISCLPGPTALIPALIQSGFSCEKFVFEGFLPKKKGKRKRLEVLFKELRSVIIYESPHRILKTLEIFREIIPSRKIVVVKELTKIHEKSYRGNPNDVIEKLQLSNLKGEYIIILKGKDE
jgi:16S rRNA (cytidine1402-2'-O)-methyltransferase